MTCNNEVTLPSPSQWWVFFWKGQHWCRSGSDYFLFYQ